MGWTFRSYVLELKCLPSLREFLAAVNYGDNLTRPRLLDGFTAA